MRRIAPLALFCTLFVAANVRADEYALDVPTLIRGATVIPQPGQRLENADILIEHGRITNIGAAIDAPAGARLVEATGLYAYPGFIDAFTRIGVIAPKTDANDERRFEGDSPSPTEGPWVEMLHAARRGVYPERRATDYLERRTATYEKHRAAGFTLGHAAPPSAMFGGATATIALDETPLRDGTLATRPLATAAFVVPERRTIASRGSYPGTILGVIASQRQFLYDAQWYRDLSAYLARNATAPETAPLDPALVAIQPVSSGKTALAWEADSADEIDRVRAMAREFGLKPWLVGARRAYKRADVIAAEQLPVIASLKLPKKPSEFKLEEKKLRKAADDRSLFGKAWETRPFAPEAEYKEITRERDELLSNLKTLDERGVQWCITTADEPDAALDNLREYIKAGLTPEAALRGLTLSPARMLGIENAAGTLEAGKRGDVALLTKPLEDEKSRVKFTVIAGAVYAHDISKAPAGGKDRRRGERFPREEPELGCGDIHGAAAPHDHADHQQPNTPETNENSETPDAEEEPEDEGQPASRPTSKPAEEEIPPGPLDVYLQHKPDWIVEREIDRKPSLRTGGSVFLANALVLTGAGEALPDTSVLVQNGKIAAIGGDLVAPDGVAAIDLTGYVLAPGVLDPHAHIALDDVNEFSLSVTPEVRVGDVIDSEQRRIYDAVAGGCTTIHAMHGSANTIGGENVILKLKVGATADQMRVPGAPRTVKFATGENVKSSRGDNTIDVADDTQLTRFPKTRMGVETTMRRALAAGRDYSSKRSLAALAAQQKRVAPPLRRDLRLEALADMIDGRLWINMHCYRADEVLRALETAESFGVRIAGLHHILEGYRIMPEILRIGASTATFADWWAYKIEAYDAVPQNAGLLLKAGINSTLKSDSADLMRHMYQEAAKCMAASNLPSDEALRLVTLNAARMFALADRLGSIEVGKDADLAVFDGHPLDTYSKCVMTMIEGELYFTHRDFDPHSPRPAARAPMTFFQDELSTRSDVVGNWLNDGSGRMPTVIPQLVPLVADHAPPPAEAGYSLIGGTVHTVSGETLPNATVVIRGDRIEAVSGEAAAPPDLRSVDVSGLHVYPGLINAAARLGLQEIEAIPVTIDTNEIGRFQPDVLAVSGVNPQSRLIEVARGAGILTTLVIPAGPFVAGQAGLFHLDGWTMPEMLCDARVGLVVRIPSVRPEPIIPVEPGRRRRFGGPPEGEDRTPAYQKAINEFFENARRYADRDAAGTEQSFNPRYAEMMPYMRREKPVLFDADSYKQILEALMFAEQFGVKPVILGGRQAWRLAPLLAEKKVPVIYEGVMSLPDRYEEWDANYRAAGVMAAAGVHFCFSHRDADLTKQLAGEAGFAVAHGLDPATALRGITLSPAEILGVAGQLGSLDAGKLANVIVTTGDVLQASTRPVHAFIRGKPVSLASDHTRAAERFADRPAPALPPVQSELRGIPSQSQLR